MAKKKGVDLKNIDLGKYANDIGQTNEVKESKKPIKDETMVGEVIEKKEEAKEVFRNDVEARLRSVPVDEVEYKKKLIKYPKHYEDEMSNYLEKAATFKKLTLQDFIVEAIEEKLISLGDKKDK